MILELHVWGPAFGLPSIDPQCLAAIALQRLSFPEDAWVLIPDHDATIGPNNVFPALFDGTLWHSGFRSIAKYLGKHSSLDQDLDEQQKAEGVAYSSLIESSAQPLLDLSLYVSYENYRQTTRPAWSAILPWHANYILPQNIRTTAKERTANLGLSALDIDNDDNRDGKKSTSGNAGPQEEVRQLPAEESIKPKSLLLPRKETIRSMLNQPKYAGRFKLDALMSSLFEPLSSLLASKPYLLTSSHPTALDCLALGYLSIALSAPVAHPWLRQTLTSKHPTLTSYTKRLIALTFGPPIHPTDIPTLNSLPANDATALSSFRSERHLTLPWHPKPQPSSITTLATTSTSLIEGLAAPLPGSRFLLPGPTILAPSHLDASAPPSAPLLFSRHLQQVAALAAGALALVAYAVVARFGVRKENGMEEFGGRKEEGVRGTAELQVDEAGAMLAALGREMWGVRERERERELVGREREVGREGEGEREKERDRGGADGAAGQVGVRAGLEVEGVGEV